jgi:subfamily B ATP-binding cassette protein MsbA
MKTYWRVIAFARPFGKHAIPYAILSFLAIVFGLLNYTILVPILNILFKQDNLTNIDSTSGWNFLKQGPHDFTHWLVETRGDSGALYIICIILIVSSLFTNVFKYFSLIIINKVRAILVRNIRKKMYDHITRLHLGFFSNERRGDLISRLTNDVQEIENSVVSTLTSLFRDPLEIIIYFSVLFVMSWKLTLITLLILPVSGVLIASISKRLKRKSVQGQQSLGHILNILDETLGGLKVIHGFTARSFMINKFDQENNRYYRLLRSMNDKRELSSPLSEVLGVCVVAIILWTGGNMVFQGEMKASEFILYIISFYKILVPSKSLTSSFGSIQRGLASAERLFVILDTPSEIVDKPKAQSADGFKSNVEFKNISFSYGGEDVLKNVSFSIEKGKTIALVGPSGGGKSTLADLVPRFHDVRSGEILLDGINIQHYKVDSLRSLMGIVTQEPILFNDTVFNNIAFGMPNATLKEVEHAARIANAHEFIEQLEEGYQTNIGDRGSKLSGGQRQRLSIARAVLKNPPILILDEATSALDSKSEKLVQEALTELMKGRTSLVIAHRLSTIQHADEIVVIREGEIAERGSHEVLMNKRGIYADLYSHQVF